MSFQNCIFSTESPKLHFQLFQTYKQTWIVGFWNIVRAKLKGINFATWKGRTKTTADKSTSMIIYSWQKRMSVFFSSEKKEMMAVMKAYTYKSSLRRRRIINRSYWRHALSTRSCLYANQRQCIRSKSNMDCLAFCPFNSQKFGNGNLSAVVASITDSKYFQKLWVFESNVELGKCDYWTIAMSQEMQRYVENIAYFGFSVVHEVMRRERFKQICWSLHFIRQSKRA